MATSKKTARRKKPWPAPSKRRVTTRTVTTVATRRGQSKFMVPAKVFINEEFNMSCGIVDGFRLTLAGRREEDRPPYAWLKFGCRVWKSRKEAEAHYDSENVSVASSSRRPYIRELIAWAAEQFEKRGYKW